MHGLHGVHRFHIQLHSITHYASGFVTLERRSGEKAFSAKALVCFVRRNKFQVY
jgi:hypothetical protein